MPAVALAGIFAVVPTLACAAGAEPLPQWPTLIALDHQTLLSHFTHLRSGKNWWEELVDLLKRKNWWTIATSALCHADAKHRDNNILGLLSVGWKPAHELGALGFALTFFGGHAAAILNTDGQRAQLRNYFNASTGGYTPQLASWASRLWDSASATRYLGGSAGVFALLGVDLEWRFKELFAKFQEVESEITLNKDSLKVPVDLPGGGRDAESATSTKK
jgi:membrane associated rhomboid family serine protease